MKLKIVESRSLWDYTSALDWMIETCGKDTATCFRVMTDGECIQVDLVKAEEDEPQSLPEKPRQHFLIAVRWGESSPEEVLAFDSEEARDGCQGGMQTAAEMTSDDDLMVWTEKDFESELDDCGFKGKDKCLAEIVKQLKALRWEGGDK